MVEQIILPNPSNEPVQALYEKELRRLKQPGALQRRLADIDNRKLLRPIYVMGCGRSGTWLLTHVMTTFSGVEVVPRELPVEYFGLLMTDRPVLVLERDHVAYQWTQQMPPSIEIADIVRHPYDVLTSHLPGTGKLYYILPERWVGELTARRHLIDSRRKNIKIVRYEDLVGRSVESQTKLGHFFRLKVRVPIDKISTISNNPSESRVPERSTSVRSTSTSAIRQNSLTWRRSSRNSERCWSGSARPTITIWDFKKHCDCN